MPIMIMPRDWTVRTRSGHTIQFKKDQPKSVPEDFLIIEECRRYGAECADPAANIALADEGPTVTDLPKTPLERRQRVLALFQEMKAHQEEHRNHFTATGKPSVRYAQTALGFDIASREVDDLWTQVLMERNH